MNTQHFFRKITRIGQFGLALLLSNSLWTASVHADSLFVVGGWCISSWNASAVTAVPAFSSNGDVAIKTYFGPPAKSLAPDHGRGVRHKTDQTGTATLHIPVTAASGSYFQCLWLRAEDNIDLGYVKASLYRQPLAGGAEQLLGSTATTDVLTPSPFGIVDGYQAVAGSVSLPGQPFSSIEIESGYSYYIELKLYRRSATAENITAYDVGLGFFIGG
ncbi:MAG: hypothetical protein AB7P69_27415 [Candidatus Binatia bacterium]